jgi:hypothetical protein
MAYPVAGGMSPEERWAALPQRERSKGLKSNLETGWPIVRSYSPNQDPNLRLGPRWSPNPPRVDMVPQFGPKPVDDVVKKLVASVWEALDYAYTGKRPDPTQVGNAWPLTPPDPVRTARFQGAASRLKTFNEGPQLKVRAKR